MSGPVRLNEMSRLDRGPLIHLENEDLTPLPAPLGSPQKDRPWNPLSDQCATKYERGLDDTCAVNIPKPKNLSANNDGLSPADEGSSKLQQGRVTGLSLFETDQKFTVSVDPGVGSFHDPATRF